MTGLVGEVVLFTMGSLVICPVAELLRIYEDACEFSTSLIELI